MNVFLLTLFLIGHAVCNNDDDYKRIDSIHPEHTCTAGGGTCTIATDCPPGLLAASGLCPEQRSEGVECCYGISVKEHRCQKLGGRCINNEEFCNPLADRSTDCPAHQKCCILV